jgi:hypothetical protein
MSRRQTRAEYRLVLARTVPMPLSQVLSVPVPVPVPLPEITFVFGDNKSF